MNALTCVCGTAGSGKTLVILGLIQLARKRGMPIGACKPVDVGDIEYQSKDLASDAERFLEIGRMPEHISLINPYLLNETLPTQLAAERDGIRLDLKLIEKRLDELSKRYPQVLIEGPSGLLTPFTDSSSWLEVIKMWHPQLIWVSGIGVSDLETSLLALRILQESGLSVKIILNSFSANQDREMIQYQWLTLEEQLKASVLGFVPYFRNELLDQMSLALESMMEEPWPNPEES